MLRLSLHLESEVVRHVQCSSRGCLTSWSIKSGKVKLPPGYDSIYRGVEQQLEILGADHIGYAHKDFTSSAGVPFAVVGARPFSKVIVSVAKTPREGPHIQSADFGWQMKLLLWLHLCMA